MNIKWPCENCGGARVVAEFIDNKIQMVNCPKCNPEKIDSFGLLLKLNNRINQLLDDKARLTEKRDLQRASIQELSEQVNTMQAVVDAAKKVKLAVDLANKHSVSENGDDFAKERLLAWYSELEQALLELEAK